MSRTRHIPSPSPWGLADLELSPNRRRSGNHGFNNTDNSTFSGGLNISGGTVQVNWNSTNSMPGSGPVKINTGGSLVLTGSYTGQATTNVININGGELDISSNTNILANSTYVNMLSSASGLGGSAPSAKPFPLVPAGISPGTPLTNATLSFVNLSLGTGSILNMNLAGTPNGDDIDMTSDNLTLSTATGAITVNLSTRSLSYPDQRNLSAVHECHQLQRGCLDQRCPVQFTAGNFNPTHLTVPKLFSFPIPLTTP